MTATTPTVGTSTGPDSSSIPRTTTTTTTTTTSQHIAGSTVAGLFSTILGHPLDSIKTHLQTKNQSSSTTITTTTTSQQSVTRNPRLMTSWQVAQTLKLSGLYRGMTPPLVNSIIMNTVMFSVFDAVQEQVSSTMMVTTPTPTTTTTTTITNEVDGTKLCTSNNNSTSNTNNVIMPLIVAGLCSGFATAMISTPTDYIKIHAQLGIGAGGNGGKKSTVSSSWSIFLRILQQQNPHLKFYRGHVANLAREGIFTMVYLGLYQYSFLVQNSGDSASKINETKSFYTIALTSSMTGALAWVMSYPMDTIKTLIQSGKQWKDIRRTISLSNLYQGCATSTSRAILVTTSRMLAYEWCIQQFTPSS